METVGSAPFPHILLMGLINLFSSHFVRPRKCSFLKQASLLAGHAKDAPFFGWRAEGSDAGNVSPAGGAGLVAGGKGKDSASHDWEGMVQGVQNYIKGLNFKYRVDLRSKAVSCLTLLV